jgi:beta-N-acetylhexosaminidase
MASPCTALAVLTGLLLACSPATEKPAASSAPANAVPNAAPPPPACGDASSLLAGISTRDKLAQLLMVGVTGADDARAVVEPHHVGGIMIGGWTDMSIMGDHCRNRKHGGSASTGCEQRRGGRRVSRLSGLISQPSPRVLEQDTCRVHGIALQRGQAAEPGRTIDFAPVVDVLSNPMTR